MAQALKVEPALMSLTDGSLCGAVEPWSRQLPAQAVPSCLFQSLPEFSEFYLPDVSPGRLFTWPLSESGLWSLCLFYKVAAVCNCFSD